MRRRRLRNLHHSTRIAGSDQNNVSKGKQTSAAPTLHLTGSDGKCWVGPTRFSQGSGNPHVRMLAGIPSNSAPPARPEASVTMAPKMGASQYRRRGYCIGVTDPSYAYAPNSYAASNSATTFCGGTPAWILCTLLKT